MVSRVLFWLYRQVMGLFVYGGARAQKVHPLELPRQERVELIPMPARKPVANLPLLHDVVRFPKADRSPARSRRIRRTRPLIGLLGRLKRPGIAPVPEDHDEMLRIVYPYFFRRAWPHPPTVPPELRRTRDLLAELATAGPFGDYVAAASPEAAELFGAAGLANEVSYVIDLEELARHPVKPGLKPIGCTIGFKVADGQLATAAIHQQSRVVTPGSAGWDGAERIAACSLTTHLSVIKHNIFIHLGVVTPFAAVTINRLAPDHPIRRLLHHCFQTALIGNYEVTQLQIRGRTAFCTTVFSYDYDTLMDVLNRHLATFDLGDLDPEESERRRGVARGGFEYAYRVDVLPLWELIRNYVQRYVVLYYPDDGAVAGDAPLAGWFGELGHLLPGGLDRYAPTLTRDSLVRICATFIHTSTVTHDNVNNIVWNYTTLPQYLPTVVPDNGGLPPADIAFDFILTVIGTWKPFNMLLDGISQLALDEAARTVMDEFIDGMRSYQAELEQRPFTHHTIYPANLNYSVSN